MWRGVMKCHYGLKSQIVPEFTTKNLAENLQPLPLEEHKQTPHIFIKRLPLTGPLLTGGAGMARLERHSRPPDIAQWRISNAYSL